jgi:hypothetical protein
MPQRHAYAERGLDLYETPAVAVEALRRVEFLPKNIWEPAAGPGAIVKALRRGGHAVLATDIVEYPGLTDVRDFLTFSVAPVGIDAIVTNPPFKLAEEFVARALILCPQVIMFLRLSFLESERRCSILENCGLARVHVFRKRVPMMHRAGWTGNKSTSSVAHAWFVWLREYIGLPTINRISWDR